MSPRVGTQAMVPQAAPLTVEAVCQRLDVVTAHLRTLAEVGRSRPPLRTSLPQQR